MNNPSQQIDNYLKQLSGWQQENLTTFRKIIHEVAPEVEETWKWEVPVFMVKGKLLCAMSTFKAHTKFNFFEGAALNDTHHLFNSGLDSKKHRSINREEGQKIEEAQLKDLLREAVERL